MRIPLEIMICVLVLGVLIALPLMSFFDGAIAFQAGVLFIAVGLGVGLPAGFYYHALLYFKRGKIGRELQNWWISPHKYHEYLPEKDQKILGWWFRVGAVFFNITIFGCGLLFVSLFMNRD